MNAITMPLIIAAALIMGALIGAKLTVKGYESQKNRIKEKIQEVGNICFMSGHRFANAEMKGATKEELQAIVDEEVNNIKNLFIH